MSVNSSDRKRLCSVAVFLSLLFCLLIVRFYQIQIIEGDKWAKAAAMQHQHILIEPSMRGSFFSNTSIKKGHPKDKQPFVVDVPKYHLFIDPDSIPNKSKAKMADQLFTLLPSCNKRGDFFKKSRSRKLAMWLSRDERDQIETWWRSFYPKEKIVKNALFFKQEFKRSYPFGSLLGAVLHTVGEDEGKPTGGLEMLLDSYLRGKEGKRLIVRTGRNPLDTGQVLEAPENGADVYLTINHYLQAILESELSKGVQTAGAHGGWAVMMDPFNGEILALAQTPAFDPSRYNEYFNDPNLIERTKVKAITDAFEPGSIFKPVTVAICMQANEELIKEGKEPLFDPDAKISCSNGWFPGRTKPLKDGRLHPFLNMEMAIQKSSNIYMGKIIHRLIEKKGDAWYRDALSNIFGFGQKTGVDLPAESTGLLPRIGKYHPNGKPEWSVPTPYSLALGHNILCNSLQLVRAYSIFANGGKGVRPHLIRKIVKNGQVVVDHTHERASEQLISPEIAKRVVRAMKFVTKKGGTSKRADILGYTEAGKSGTAEKIINGCYAKEHNVSSFIGFAPAHRPRFVLMVTIDDPERKRIPGWGRNQFGGICAAPVFREVATKALQYLGVSPDDPYGYAPGDPRSDLKKANWADEIEKITQLYQEWNAR